MGLTGKEGTALVLMISDPLYITNEKSKGPSGTLSLFGQNKRAAEHRFGSHFVNMKARNAREKK